MTKSISGENIETSYSSSSGYLKLHLKEEHPSAANIDK